MERLCLLCETILKLTVVYKLVISKKSEPRQNSIILKQLLEALAVLEPADSLPSDPGEELMLEGADGRGKQKVGRGASQDEENKFRRNKGVKVSQSFIAVCVCCELLRALLSLCILLGPCLLVVFSGWIHTVLLGGC